MASIKVAGWPHRHSIARCCTRSERADWAGERFSAAGSASCYVMLSNLVWWAEEEEKGDDDAFFFE